MTIFIKLEKAFVAVIDADPDCAMAYWGVAMSKPGKALESYQIDLLSHPNRFNGLYGAAQAAKSMGNEILTLQYFAMLLALTEGATSNRPEIAEAREFVLKQKNSLVSEVI